MAGKKIVKAAKKVKEDFSNASDDDHSVVIAPSEDESQDDSVSGTACDYCNSTGLLDPNTLCPQCSGTGKV